MDQDVLNRLEDIKIEFLRHHTQESLRNRKIVVDIDTVDPNRAARLVAQGTKKTKCGRLASTVWH